MLSSQFVDAVKGIRRLSRDEEGGSMVEFAIVAGLLMTPIMLGILSFGFAAWAKNSVTSDAREGARYAIVHGLTASTVADSFAVRDYVRSRTSLETTGPNAIRVHTKWPTTNLPGQVVEVSVAHPVPRRDPFFIPAHTDSAVSKMVILF
jgi:Flp pilus assembly protein TadG